METRTALCRLDSAWTRTDEGYLDAAVYPTKAGVFLYLNKDGSTRRELRPRSEVHDAASLKTLENKPHTNSHPPVLLNSKNTKQYQTGNVYGKHEVAEDGIHTKARVMVTDEATINDIQSGKEQVSCGYTCDIDNTAGVDPEFGEYDAIQRNIKYNHLASEWRGRAGAGAAIKRDSDEDHVRFDAYEIESDTQIKNDQERSKMIKFDVDGHEVEVSEAAKIALSAKFKVDADKVNALALQAEKAKEQAEKLQAKLDEASDKIKALEAIDHNQRIDQAIELREQLKPILGNDYQFKGKSELQVKKDAIAKLRPDANLEGKSETYVFDRYDMVIEDYKATKKDSKNDVAGALDNAESRSDSWGDQYGLMD